MKRKIIALAMVLVMSLGLLAGCSGGGGTSSGGDQKEVVNLTWYAYGNQPKNGSAVIEALNKKSAEDIGVTVDFHWINTDDSQALSLLSSGDSSVDLIFVCSWFGQYVDSARKGYLYDMTPLLEGEFKDFYDWLPEVMWDCARVNGNIYAFPQWKDNVATKYWYANTEFLEIPGARDAFQKSTSDLDTLTPFLQIIKDWHDEDPVNNQYGAGGTAPYNFQPGGLKELPWGWEMLNTSLAIGLKVSEGDTKVRSFFEEPEAAQNYKTLKYWAENGLSNGLEASSAALSATIVPTVDSAMAWEGAESVLGGPALGYEVEMQKIDGPLLTTENVQGAMNAIGANSKHPVEAMKYLAYINMNADFANMLAYGIEGVNWEKTEEGSLVQLNDDWTPMAWSLTSFRNLIPPAPSAADMYTKLTGSVEDAAHTELLGFLVDNSATQDLEAACASVIAEYRPDLSCGIAEDVDAMMSEMMERLNELGYQDIIAEYQRQVDEYLAGK